MPEKISSPNENLSLIPIKFNIVGFTSIFDTLFSTFYPSTSGIFIPNGIYTFNKFSMFSL